MIGLRRPTARTIETHVHAAGRRILSRANSLSR